MIYIQSQENQLYTEQVEIKINLKDYDALCKHIQKIMYFLMK